MTRQDLEKEFGPMPNRKDFTSRFIFRNEEYLYLLKAVDFLLERVTAAEVQKNEARHINYNLNRDLIRTEEQLESANQRAEKEAARAESLKRVCRAAINQIEEPQTQQSYLGQYHAALQAIHKDEQ